MIDVADYKNPQCSKISERYLSPQKLYLPLAQHTGKPSDPCVKAGDIAEEAGLIAKQTGYISANLHSPHKGRILNVDDFYHPNLKRTKSIIIQCLEGEKRYFLRRDASSLNKAQLREIIQNSGIVGMGGAAFPTHVKLNPPKQIETLIINGCECEPYLTPDHRLMLENLKEIFMGIEIICKIVNPKQVIFALEDHSKGVIKKINLFKSLQKFKLPSFNLLVLKTIYPQGGEKQLIYSATKRKIPPGRLPLDVGCLVHNIATCFAIYEAVYLSKPLIERLVTFAGEALVSPKNIWVKIGTTLRELFDNNILQFKCEPQRIICGGPMMGVTLDSLDYPILKSNGGFLFLKDSGNGRERICIKCARCVDSCPMNLLPLEYAKRVKNEEYDALDDLNITDCIECGCCSYVCPAKIPLVHYIRMGKRYRPQTMPI